MNLVMLENNYCIYGLIDPILKVPFYFGKGRVNRPYDHLNGRDKNNKEKCNYIQKIRQLGQEPYIEYVQSNITDERWAYELETFCIREGKQRGLPLTNKIPYKPHKIRKYKPIDPQKVYNLYIIQGKTALEISQILGEKYKRITSFISRIGLKKHTTKI